MEVLRSMRLRLTLVIRLGRRKPVWITLCQMSIRTGYILLSIRGLQLAYVSMWNNPHAVRRSETSMSWDNCSGITLSPLSPTRPSDSPVRMAWCSILYPRSSSSEREYLQNQISGLYAPGLMDGTPTSRIGATCPAARSVRFSPSPDPVGVPLRRGNPLLWS